jgi:hypothetical protein
MLSSTVALICRAIEYAQLIDVWMENAIHESNARALIGILIWQLDMDLP